MANNQSSEDVSSNKTKHTDWFHLFWTPTLCIGIVFLIIFIFLPAIFVLLGSLWPDLIPGIEAISQLNNSVNKLVGIVSLAVGVCSIIYSYISNKHMEVQSEIQRSFLQELKSMLETNLFTLKEMKESNSAFYNKFANMADEKLSAPTNANED